MAFMLDDEHEKVAMLKNSDVEVEEELTNAVCDLMEANAVIHQLRIAGEKALELRGLWVALSDPLALEGEKKRYRERFLQIESEISGAVKTAKIYNRKDIARRKKNELDDR